MDRIKLHDKYFKKYIPYEKIEKEIARVAEQLNKDMKEVDTPIFLSVLSGSFMFTADLMKKIDFQCDITFVKLSSYCGTSSTGEVKEIMGLSKNVEGRSIVIVEDIVDTGTTIEELVKILKEKGVAEIKVCTLMFKPDSYKKEIKIDYVAMEIPNDFIVGFGLDYDQLGRQYKDIYIIDDK
jgi:hypoxanthine phosphoribosyltransferase